MVARTRARQKVVTNLEELHGAMDEEDAEIVVVRDEKVRSDTSTDDTSTDDDDSSTSTDDSIPAADDDEKLVDDIEKGKKTEAFIKEEDVSIKEEVKKEDASEDELDDDDVLIDEVKNADTTKGTKHGYRLSLQRFIVFHYYTGCQHHCILEFVDETTLSCRHAPNS